MEESDLLDGFEEWLRSVCFQKPSPGAYDLARDAWLEAAKSNNIEWIEQAFIEASKNIGW